MGTITFLLFVGILFGCIYLGFKKFMFPNFKSVETILEENREEDKNIPVDSVFVGKKSRCGIKQRKPLEQRDALKQKDSNNDTT